ncbi:hypothetical protein GCM10022393_19100 [Aquimarina addita]|uniref:Uncharacterized protein n=1 Tax=Aquimarina addita TaxID=870485 RepID=A0ABP6UL53_9FLAO
MKKTTTIALTIVFLIFTKFWVGLYEHDEFFSTHIFIKHRPIWKTYFYSPRGMSDRKLLDMPENMQVEQQLFDEFILNDK